jgi:hypothetical protein
MKCVIELMIRLQEEINSKFMDFQSFQDTLCLIESQWMISTKCILELSILGPEVKCLEDFQKNAQLQGMF